MRKATATALLLVASLFAPPAGAGLTAQTVDIAVTLSTDMGIKPPSGSVGVPLTEVLEE